MLASRLKGKFSPAYISSLLYFEVFIFTFGFYGIWGRVIIDSFLSPFIAADLISHFSDISLLLGLPFLVFAWLMFLKFSFELSGRRFTGWNFTVYLVTNFTILIVVGYLIVKNLSVNPIVLYKYYFIIMSFIYSLSGALIILSRGKKRTEIHDHDRNILFSGIIISMLMQCTPLFFYESQEVLGIVFIFLFFTGNTFLPVFMTYGTLLPAFTRQHDNNLSFNEFCKKFTVSPRESDIVLEICNGLSNKEIAEKLFISLQTVKDHTHHIYIKTNVKSRVQLITLVKEEIGS